MRGIRSSVLIAVVAVLAVAALTSYSEAAEKSLYREKVKKAGAPASAPVQETTLAGAGTALSVSPVDTAATSTPSTSTASPSSGEQVKWMVLSSGGSFASSPGYNLGLTIGQTAVGLTSSPAYKINQGFWQVFAGGSCCFGTTGNVDGDPGDLTDISDLSAMVDYLFFSGSISSCFPESDVDSSGSIDISDLQKLIDFLFFGMDLPSCT